MEKYSKYIMNLLLVIILLIGLWFISSKAMETFNDHTKNVIDNAVKSINESNANVLSGASNKVESPENNSIEDDLSNKMIEINLGYEQIQIDTNYTNTIYEVKSLYSDVPMKVSIGKNSSGMTDDITVFVDGQDISENSMIQVDSIGKESFIEIIVENENNHRRVYYIQTLPTSFPEIEKHGISTYEGEYYSNFYLENSSYIYKMSNDGDILYYKLGDKGRDNYVNFAKWDVGGKERYSYFNENHEGAIDLSAYNFGDYVIMDENYQIIDRVHSLPSQKYPIDTNKKAEMHDFIMIADGHYIILNYVMDTPNPEHLNDKLKINTRILAAYIQEIKDGDVVWEWLSTDYSEFYDSSIEGNDYSNSTTYAEDYMHVNSMFIDPKDGNLLLSLRNQDSIIKIDKKTNEVMWRFGGVHDDYGLSDKQKPSKQHHATVTEAGNLLVYDNGTANNQTRILEVKLDEENKKVLEFEEFLLEGVYTGYTGSVQKLDEENDVFLIGWGMARNHHALMSEVDFKNNIMLSEVVEPTKSIDAYRFMKFK